MFKRFQKTNVEVFKNNNKNAWTLLYNLTGTEWELAKDSAFALKHVQAINEEQYTKTVNQVCICVFIKHTVRWCTVQSLK